MSRLPRQATHRVDPDRSISFTWQGRGVTGLAGDTVASALFAAGTRIFSRSLKYHRPRGLYSLDGESGNTLVNVDGECNVRAETMPLGRGMRVAPQNSWVMSSAESDGWAPLCRSPPSGTGV